MTQISRRGVLALLAGVPIMLAGPARAATHRVTIRNFAFLPATLDVAAGDTVEFYNDDGVPHTATDRNGIFDTSTIRPGTVKSVEITSAGTYDYLCKFHPAMKGRISAR